MVLPASLIHNLPALQVVLPLVAAPICALLTRNSLSKFFSIFTVILTFIISISLYVKVKSNLQITYNMGGWSSPIGIEYSIDYFNALLLVLISFIALMAIFSADNHINNDKKPATYALFLLCLAGFLGITVTNDSFNVYVFLEIASLSSYALIASGNDKRSLTSALDYLVVGTIAATLILLGVGLLYAMTGTLNFDDLGAKIQNNIFSLPVKAGFIFVIIGLLLKIAIFPMHIWLPNIYQYSPNFFVTFIAGIASKVSIYLLIKYLYIIAGHHNMINIMQVIMLSFLAGGGILCGAIGALRQVNIKRILAYSSIMQISYMILSVSIGNFKGLVATIIFFITHAITKSTLFNLVAKLPENADLKSLNGVGKNHKGWSLAWTINALNLAAIPLTGGFMAKWWLLSALAEKHYWLLIGCLVISSICTIYYIWRMIEAIYFSELNDNIAIKQNNWLENLAIWLPTLISLWIGFNMEYLTKIAVTVANNFNL